MTQAFSQDSEWKPEDLALNSKVLTCCSLGAPTPLESTWNPHCSQLPDPNGWITLRARVEPLCFSGLQESDPNAVYAAKSRPKQCVMVVRSTLPVVNSPGTTVKTDSGAEKTKNSEPLQATPLVQLVVDQYKTLHALRDR